MGHQKYPVTMGARERQDRKLTRDKRELPQVSQKEQEKGILGVYLNISLVMIDIYCFPSLLDFQLVG